MDTLLSIFNSDDKKQQENVEENKGINEGNNNNENKDEAKEEEENKEEENDEDEDENKAISKKEEITQSLEQRSLDTENSFSIDLELGDILEFIAPTNPDVDQSVFIITYIDNSKIKLVNVANYQQYKISITEEGTFTDESITQINILSRSKEKGYARQNNLLPKTWIDIDFGGDLPAIITGEITNLEGDMIEVTTFPELSTIYINFGYKGIPENIPINKIKIRSKPAAVTVNTLSMLKGIPLEKQEAESLGTPEASIEYTESGESIITIPPDVTSERNVRDQLHDMYLEANEIFFGEKLGEINQLVEIPEENQRYGIDVQVNDMMDELLSTIPNSQRTKSVLDNIRLLIERYKQLRINFSKFDKNNNAYDVKMLGAAHKPLIEHLEKMNQKLHWIIPVVSQRRKLYDISSFLDTNEISIESNANTLRDLERKQMSYYKDNSKDPLLEYKSFCNEIQDIFTPFTEPVNAESYLYNGNVETNIDTVVSNLENFYSTVSQKETISRKQYLIQTYNLGFSGLEDETLKTRKTVYARRDITPNDKITVKSLLMLPEPVIRYSAVNLPGTNILEKSSLSQNTFMLYRFLKKRLDIQPHTINDITKEFNYEKMEKNTAIPLFNEVHEFSLSDEVMDEDKYHKFLEAIIPKTRFLIRLIRKYLNNNLTFLDIVERLEPFTVYSTDITYKQYLEIRYVIKGRLDELKIEINKRSADFSTLKNAKYNVFPLPNPLLRFINENKKYVDSFSRIYEFFKKNQNNNNNQNKRKYVSTGETLTNMIDIDNGSLYSNIITSILISLITPKQLIDVLNEPKIDDITDMEKIKASDCARKYLAKHYTSIKEMQKDNAVDELYFDKDFDDTPYSIMKKYEKEKKTMSPELFQEFLKENLISKHDCPREQADELAKTMIAGKKLVKDGDYAMLEIRPTLPSEMGRIEDMSEKEKADIEIEARIRKRIQYYRRMKDNWNKDNDIDEESFLDTSALFCNVSEKCYKNKNTSVCETLDETAERMKTIARKKILDEFDKRYTMNADELEKEVDGRIEILMKHIKNEYNLREIQKLKQTRLAHSIGVSASQNEILASPHLKLRDLILGQDDFVKKQADICRFADIFCREPLVEQQGESPYWKYCKDTNTKLLPQSIFELAESFVTGMDYTIKLAEVCRKVGILSDDADSIVDKYSGFVLRKIDFSSEEGFDESGFRVTTNDILEQDLGAILEDTAKKTLGKRVFESETAEVVFNVLSTICRNIDIPLESVDEFVLRNSLDMFDKIIYSETSYQKKSDKQLKDKGKPLQPYKNYRDETRITIIACNILISVQIAIPSLQSKKTFPGCIRSFSGFPLSGGVEDTTGMQYLACVLSKTTSSISIWESIKKYKPEVLAKRMKDIFDNFIMKRSDIMEMYSKKREYMLLYPELVSPQEHNIKKWVHFMPPVVPFSLTKTLQNVSSDFEEDLRSLIRKGSEKQNESINVLKSKILFFGYGIIEDIQNIVEKKDVLLKTSGNVPFLENACCNESIELTSPIQYFVEENEQIKQYIRNVILLSRMLKMTKDASKAAFLFHSGFTGVRHSNVSSNNLNDNDIIYAAIIHYCNFDKGLPIPDKFKDICNEKPAGYDSNWSILEKIEFLKKNGNQYTVDNLLHLMNIVNRENIVDLSEPPAFTRINVVRDVIENLEMENSKVIDEPLRKLMGRVLEAHKPKTVAYEITNELNNLQNYLLKANRDMYREIMDFFGRYGNLTDRKYGQLNDFLQNICTWKLDKSTKETGLYYDSGLYTVAQYIQNAVQCMCKTYPNILLNDVGFYKKIPKHWGFSDKHNAILSQFINKYYENIETFKEDRILYRLLMEISQRLSGLNMFLQNIPISTEIVKDFGDDVEGERVRRFYHLLDKPTIYLLFSYCFYSILYEYIDCTNDVDLLRADIEEVKKGKREELRNLGDNLLHINSPLQETDPDLAEADMDLNEVDIHVGNKEELKSRVAVLLLSFLDIEEENKKTLDMSYEDIQKKVRRNKDIERRNLIDRLTRMSIEQRKVEDDLKKYRLEHWHIGKEKGLYEYDKNAFDREIENMIMDQEQGVDVGQTDENEIDESENIQYNRGMDIEGMAADDGALDMDYNYNDDEEGDFTDN
jgi:hypothetical protein